MDFEYYFVCTKANTGIGFADKTVNIKDKNGVHEIPYSEIKSIKSIPILKVLVDADAKMEVVTNNNQIYTAYYNRKKPDFTADAIDFALKKIDSSNIKLSDVKKETGVIYSLDGARGRHIDVYSDKCVFTVAPGFGSLLAGGISNGNKTVYYVDCIGVQFKEGGYQLGYIQLETAVGGMTTPNSNFFGENSFAFDSASLSNERMKEVYNYISKQIDDIKHNRNNGTKAGATAVSSADEILKFKQLLDAGVITQEEFDSKKKQLLGL